MIRSGTKLFSKANPGLVLESPVTTVRSAAKRMLDGLQEPEIDSLVGEIWKRGELHILFADNGTGKSLLGIQMAHALTSGNNLFGLPELVNENDPLVTLVYDFELSDKQFQVRYTDPITHRRFEFRDELKFDTVDWYELDKKARKESRMVEELLFEQIQNAVWETGAKILVIDNLTYLQSTATEKTDTALALMRRLVELKRSLDLSILVIAHTPKVNPGEALNANHLAGSKQISNFADGVSAIGKSVQGASYRYWKQIKPSRSGEHRYTSDNVLTCLLEKIDNTFLGFRFLRHEDESVHLRKSSKDADEEKLAMLLDLKKQGFSYREIEERTGISKSTVSRILKEQEEAS